VRSLTALLFVIPFCIAAANEPGEQSDSTLERQLRLFQQIRSLARENAKRVSGDPNISAELNERIKTILPDSLSSHDLSAMVLLCRIAEGIGPAEDHRYTDLFFRAETRCASLFIGRPDGLYWLRQLKCGTDGGRAEILDEYIAAAERKRGQNSSR
jgi:hypothetical protein